MSAINCNNPPTLIPTWAFLQRAQCCQITIYILGLIQTRPSPHGTAYIHSKQKVLLFAYHHKLLLHSERQSLSKHFNRTVVNK